MSDLTSWLTQTVEIAGRATPGRRASKPWMEGQRGCWLYTLGRGSRIAQFVDINQTDANEDGEGPANIELAARMDREIVTAMCGVVAAAEAVAKTITQVAGHYEVNPVRLGDLDRALAELRATKP